MLHQFYQYVQSSDLVPAEDLECIYQSILNRGSESTLDAILSDLSEAEPITLERLQHLPKLSNRKPESEYVNREVADASLDDDNAVQDRNFTPQDIQLSEELIRRGFLNRWQTEQLLNGKTKFSLGKYRIFDAVGKGGYGHVFLGRESAREQFVAIKVLPLNKATPELSQRFLHEIKLQKNLRHPNLVSFLDSGRDGNVHYMVHEFVDGGDLRSWFQREGILPLNVVAGIAAQIARGIQYLHDNGIVHRDIKPANILLSSSGSAKLIDLGLAVSVEIGFTVLLQNRDADESNTWERQIDSITAPGRVAGTVDYMAPDQLANPQTPAPAWDIYSLGCTLYQLLTGSVPFPTGDTTQKFQARLKSEPKDARIFNQTIPFDVADLLRSMLAKHPGRRTATAQEVADRLDVWGTPFR